MRKFVLQMQMSADGFFGAKSPVDWQLWGWGEKNQWDGELRHDFNAFFEGVDTIVLSRRMAEDGYIDHWTQAAGRYPADPFFKFARRVVEIEKVVLSDRLNHSPWPRTSVASGNLPLETAALKSKSGGAIVAFGGVSFAAALLDAALVDELQIYINPYALGQGVSLLAPSGARRLRLLSSKSYSCGMIVACYTRDGGPP